MAATKILAVHLPMALLAAGTSTAVMSALLLAGVRNPYLLRAAADIPLVFLDAYAERMLEQLGPTFTQPTSTTSRYSRPQLRSRVLSSGLEFAAFVLTALQLIAQEKAVLGSNAGTNAGPINHWAENLITVFGHHATNAGLRFLYKAAATGVVAAEPSTGVEVQPWNPRKNTAVIAVGKGINWKHFNPSNFRKADKKTREAFTDMLLRLFVVLPVSSTAWPALMSLTGQGVNYTNARVVNTIGGAAARAGRPFALDAIMYRSGKQQTQDVETGRVVELPDDAPYAHGETIPLEGDSTPQEGGVVDRTPTATDHLPSTPAPEVVPTPQAASVTEGPAIAGGAAETPPRPAGRPGSTYSDEEWRGRSSEIRDEDRIQVLDDDVHYEHGASIPLAQRTTSTPSGDQIQQERQDPPLPGSSDPSSPIPQEQMEREEAVKQKTEEPRAQTPIQSSSLPKQASIPEAAAIQPEDAGKNKASQDAERASITSRKSAKLPVEETPEAVTSQASSSVPQPPVLKPSQKEVAKPEAPVSQAAEGVSSGGIRAASHARTSAKDSERIEAGTEEGISSKPSSTSIPVQVAKTAVASSARATGKPLPAHGSSLHTQAGRAAERLAQSGKEVSSSGGKTAGQVDVPRKLRTMPIRPAGFTSLRTATTDRSSESANSRALDEEILGRVTDQHPIGSLDSLLASERADRRAEAVAKRAASLVPQPPAAASSPAAPAPSGGGERVALKVVIEPSSENTARGEDKRSEAMQEKRASAASSLPDPAEIPLPDSPAESHIGDEEADKAK